MNPMLDAALSYAARGWDVFPVHGILNGRCTCGGANCSAGKHPIYGGGFKVATTDAQTIRDWWEAHPYANVAIATGAASGLIVIDIDDGVGKSGSRSLAALEAENGLLPTTHTVQTGSGGRHLYFRMPDVQLGSSAGKLGENLDVRANGGYVVAAPSAHISGGSYVCQSDAPLADAPAWLVAKLVEPTQSKMSGGMAGTSLATAFAEGRRNDTLVKMGGNLRRNGWDRDGMETLLNAMNDEMPVPLEQSEIRKMARSLANYDAGEAPVDDIPLSRLVAQNIAHQTRCASGLGWLHYTEGRWRESDDKPVRAQVKRQLEMAAELVRSDGNPEKARQGRSLLTAKKLASIVSLVSCDEAVSVGAEDFDTKSGVLNLANGTLDLTTCELRPHDHNDLLTKIAPTVYDPNAECPTFDRLLSASLPPHHAAFLMRFFAYAMLGDPVEQVFAIFHGAGANGKSKIVEGVGDTLGNYAAETDPSTFMKKDEAHARNQLALLRGVHVVMTSELGPGQIMNAPLMKQLTGGESVQAKRLYQDTFMFRPKCTIIMTTNSMPVIDGGDKALARRIITVPFPNVVPPEQRDKQLRRKLNQEKSGILNRLLAGLNDYRENGLNLPSDLVAAATRYADEADMIALFLEETCEARADGTIPAGGLYQSYARWAVRGGLHALSMPLFKTEMEKRRYKQKRTAGGYVWKEIGYKKYQGEGYILPVQDMHP